jgi:glycosyltransferase involved in cell wall biosynthesis
VTCLARASGVSVGDPVEGLESHPNDEICLDIVIPAHNEAHRIGPTLHAYSRGLPHPKMRFIVALDSCDDETAEVAARHAEADPRVQIHDFPKLGKGGVIRHAFDLCEADLVAFVDADGSTAPGQLAHLVRSMRHADGAIASRRLPESSVQGDRGLARAAASALFAWLVRLLFALPYRDTQCGAKVIRREALELLLPRVTTSDLLFDVDLLVQAQTMGYCITEVPTIWVERPGSKVRLVRDLGDVAGSLLRLWMAQRRSWIGPLSAMSEQLDRGRSAA